MPLLSKLGSGPGATTSSASTQPCASSSPRSSGLSGPTTERMSSKCSSTPMRSSATRLQPPAEPVDQQRAEVLAVGGQLHDGLEVVEAVAGVVAAAAEDDAVHRLGG